MIINIKSKFSWLLNVINLNCLIITLQVRLEKDFRESSFNLRKL